MPKVHVDGIDVHYVSVGRGPDVVMLHGLLGNLAVWHLHIVPALQREFRVTTYDLRGHGYTDMTPTGYASEDLARDLKGLLDRLEIERPTLIGHSYGADVCLHFSLLYPQRVSRVIAIEAGLAALVHERNRKDWEGWSYWVSKLEEVGISVPPEKRSDLQYLLNLSLETPRFYGPARGLPRKREPLIRFIHTTSLVKDYEAIGSMTLEAVRRIQTPTMIVYGDESHFLGTYKFLREALPNQTEVVLPGGQHFAPLEQPEILTKHILEFLRKPETASAPQAVRVGMMSEL